MKYGLEHLYAQTWAQIDYSTRQAWLTLLLTTCRGANFSSIQKWSGLTTESLCDSLEVLTSLHVIEKLDSTEAPRFRLHSSARDFLNQKISGLEPETCHE